MQKFGVRVLEGYGATECSPVVAVNVPMHPRAGWAGRLLPAVEYRLEHVEGVSGNDPQVGRLLVRGPNIMRGYLNPEPNAKFLALNGWYDTGDIVRVDEHRFVQVLGRLKRFAKVSGEMVSLGAVEDALAIRLNHHGSKFAVAVIARRDESKGEKLVAVTNEPCLTLEEVREAVRGAGLGNLAAPRELKVVPEMPLLATGKVDYRSLEKMM
jgi:acyl-[acyl-carrier-protein]-phospholipid O-acyltransferase/long-chain-fatty-acid--[acyl-carrier-protein] ligase